MCWFSFITLVIMSISLIYKEKFIINTEFLEKSKTEIQMIKFLLGEYCQMHLQSQHEQNTLEVSTVTAK